MIRLLVVDGSRLAEPVFTTIVPSGVSVAVVDRFDHARALLTTAPPDAAIFSVPPSALPWHELVDICRRHRPPIPFRCFSTTCGDDLAREPAEICCPEVLPKPDCIAALRQTIESLLFEAQAARRAFTTAVSSSLPPS